MNQWPSIVFAWTFGVVVIGGYAALIVRRGRRLSRQVPPSARRWIRS